MTYYYGYRYSVQSQDLIELDTDEFFAILYSIRNFPDEVSVALRYEALAIAEEIIKPAVISSIVSHAPSVGPKLAQTVRTYKDRIPNVKVGNSGYPMYSGKKKKADYYGPDRPERIYSRRSLIYQADRRANTNMLRYGTIVGPYETGYWSRRNSNVVWPKNVVKPGWPTAASNKFYEPTFREWSEAVRKLILLWNEGKL